MSEDKTYDIHTKPTEPGMQPLANDGCLASDHERGWHTPARPAPPLDPHAEFLIAENEREVQGIGQEFSLLLEDAMERSDQRAKERAEADAEILRTPADAEYMADLHEAARMPCFCNPQPSFVCTHHMAKHELELRRPKVVVLCGSTRFYDHFMQADYDETMAGNIVLSVGFARISPQARAEVTRYKHESEDIGCTPEQKVALDDLHKRKIDMADEVIVLNVGGYVGKSTASEIEYAEMCGKPIRWLEPPR